jgi:subtilisin family serine protease
MSRFFTHKLFRIGFVVGIAISLVVATTSLAGASASSTRSAFASDPQFAHLRDLARRDGSVPVVVGLATTGAAKGASAEQVHQAVAVRDRVLARFGTKHPAALRSLRGAPFFAMRADAKDLDNLAASPDVTGVALDGVHDVAGTSSNGSSNQLTKWWDLTRVNESWLINNGYTGTGQNVVIIDTGVDKTHPWLQGKVVNEACFATNTDGTGACPNGSYADYSAATGGVPGSAAPCTYHWICAHGTHVAHTAAGKYGIARGATITAIRASHKEWDTKLGAYVPKFSDSDLANALWYVYGPLPYVPASINMSIGGAGSTTTCDGYNTNSKMPGYWITALRSTYNVATVISSGNENYSNAIDQWSCVSSAVAVGNTTLDTAGNDAVFGNISYGSNSSSLLDLLAPGTDICSAVPVSLDVRDGTADGVDCSWIGTSMAAPHVAGAIAILRQARGNVTVSQMVSALQRDGSAVTDSRNNITRSRINVANAVYYF